MTKKGRNFSAKIIFMNDKFFHDAPCLYFRFIPPLNNSFLFENGDFFINIYRLFPYYFLKFRLFFNFFHAIKNTLCLVTEGVLDLKAGDDLLSHG